MHPGAVRLHLRARRIDQVAAALVLLAPATGWAATWFVDHQDLSGGQWPLRPPMTTLAPLIAAALIGFTLAGADVELERSVSRSTFRLRAVHAGTALAVLCLSSSSWLLLSGAGAGAVRNTLGLAGLVLLASTVRPAATAWAPALGWALLAYYATPPERWGGSTWWGWTVQPAGAAPAGVVAVVLALAGALAYAVCGPARADVRRG